MVHRDSSEQAGDEHVCLLQPILGDSLCTCVLAAAHTGRQPVHMCACCSPYWATACAHVSLLQPILGDCLCTCLLAAAHTWRLPVHMRYGQLGDATPKPHLLVLRLKRHRGNARLCRFQALHSQTCLHSNSDE